MSPLAWRILMLFIDHAKQRSKKECWYEDYPGYIASWTLGEMLDGDATTIQSATVHHNPGNEYEIALRELIDLGLVREMPNLGERFELVVREPAKDVEMRFRQSEKSAEPTVAEYWTYPPSVQGKIREKVDLDELLSETQPTLCDLAIAKYGKRSYVKQFAEEAHIDRTLASQWLHGRDDIDPKPFYTILGLTQETYLNAWEATQEDEQARWRANHPPTMTDEEWQASIKKTADEVYAKMTDAQKKRLHQEAVKLGLVQKLRSPLDIMIDRACGLE